MSRKAKVGPESKKTTSIIDWAPIASFPYFSTISFSGLFSFGPHPFTHFSRCPVFFLLLFCSFFKRGWQGFPKTLANTHDKPIPTSGEVTSWKIC
ncbi:hypothetical protein QBC36DRAFT_328140 [Triangularia setosa]|uniref:Uncharacterized protein n=1 Tax=Triangularia setosa TaxID=2587417 RepID=A0AAN6W805_9PEZI|nr:hypothetical protein QBC36DRAFT_328140 [Podospora setosa]